MRTLRDAVRHVLVHRSTSAAVVDRASGPALLAVALLATWLPARRAATGDDPMRVLRNG